MITIGLINNMPDPALRATQGQFERLLRAAAGAHEVRLKLFFIPEVPRGEAGRAYVLEHCQPIDDLWDEQLDGLIVTGTEPRARALEDEPYWVVLAAIVSWAERNTRSAIWSCLAAQAAVLQSDGVARRPLARKLSGVFDCEKAGDHPLTAGLPPRWQCPHTRYYNLDETDLAARGYQILSRLPGRGVDAFTSDKTSLFLFLQGHPEYGPGALLAEYRRDITRFLMGQRQTYPDDVHNYFGSDTSLALDEFRARALRRRDPALLQHFSAMLAGWTPPQTWQDSAARLYAGWLDAIAARQPAAMRESAGHERRAVLRPA